MAIKKDDPIYYKKKITELIKQAKENGISVYMQGAKHLNFKCEENEDVSIPSLASIDLMEIGIELQSERLDEILIESLDESESTQEIDKIINPYF